jgi:hypothetical protein
MVAAPADSGSLVVFQRAYRRSVSTGRSPKRMVRSAQNIHSGSPVSALRSDRGMSVHYRRRPGVDIHTRRLPSKSRCSER